MVEKSRREKASDTIERGKDGERDEEGREGKRVGNVKDQCHQDCGPVFVSVATYHSIVCLQRTRQCSERMEVVVGGLVKVRL